jgi:ribosomal protein S12 methylthiotransferase
MEFVKSAKFDRLGVFPYSEEEGTYSATRLKDDVADEIKHERVDRIMRLQERVSLENNAKRIGQTMRVIIDRREGDFYIGRSEYDSPEVDQEIIIDSLGKRLYRGRFYDVVITDCEDYDLFASLA